jgi:hypothetical protein
MAAPIGTLRSSTVLDSGGLGGIGVLQMGALGSGNTTLNADDNNG